MNKNLEQVGVIVEITKTEAFKPAVTEHICAIDCIHSISQNGVTIESTAMLEGRSETN